MFLSRLTLHHRSCGDFAVFGIAPERNEEFARERDNANAAEPTAPTAKLALIPLGQRAVALVPGAAPGELHHETAHMFIAGARNALIMHAVAALIGSRHQPYQPAQLSSVFDLTPPEDFRGQGPGADRADPAQRGEGGDIPAHRGRRLRGECRTFRVHVRERAIHERELRPAPLGWEGG